MIKIFFKEKKMKITQSKLKQIIKEEIEAVMTEEVGSVRDMNFLKKMLGFKSRDAAGMFIRIDLELEDLENKFKKLQRGGRRTKTSQFEALLDELEGIRRQAERAFGVNAKNLGDSSDKEKARQKIKDITALIIQVEDHSEKRVSKDRADKIRDNEELRQYRREKEEKEFEKSYHRNRQLSMEEKLEKVHACIERKREETKNHGVHLTTDQFQPYEDACYRQHKVPVPSKRKSYYEE